MKRLVPGACTALLLALLTGCGASMPARETMIPPADKYDVNILRDTWGVPHIFGKRDADVAYGLAYAHCEDDFETIQQGLFLCRGKLATLEGMKGAPLDFLMGVFEGKEIVAREYEKQLSPETRAICDAYADGVNHYAALHPEKTIPGVYPATGQDIVAGFVMKTPLFFGLEGQMRRLFGDGPKPEVSQKQARATDGNSLSGNLPIGSNTFGVAPKRTDDGSTLLNINSHQPWTGPVAWYEAHLHSEEGWDIVGGVFPGTPVILHGHNRELGWAHTVNSPDLADIYELEINPDNSNQYKFDGEWRELERFTVPITVKLWAGLTWTVEREAFRSVYGPTVRVPHGTYAIRYAGWGDIRIVEQWYRMNKSKNINEFEQAMRMQAIPSFNVGYADHEGNIWYIYNARFPKRAEGYNWEQYLPGNTSETLWTEYLPFDSLPMVRNPESGFFQNCNGTPFQTTTGDENPKEADFSKTLGIETDMKNRGLRAMELFGADPVISVDDFYRYKYDTRYSEKSDAYKLREELLNAPPSDDPVVREAIERIRAWDGDTNLENTNASIAILSMEPIVRAQLLGGDAPKITAALAERAHMMMDKYGRLDVPWSEVNRLVRGDYDTPLCGGPDTMHAVYGDLREGRLIGVAGDCYVLMVRWDKEGKVHSRSIHQFGSATMDARSPHYADQAKLFINCQTKPVWLDEAEIRQHLEADYRPGEPRPAPKGPGSLESNGEPASANPAYCCSAD
jgi:acyl-homoserine-lactone acylase